MNAQATPRKAEMMMTEGKLFCWDRHGQRAMEGAARECTADSRWIVAKLETSLKHPSMGSRQPPLSTKLSASSSKASVWH